MGFMSRWVLPACGSLCCFYPSLRARSRQPVKRYKKLITDTFPQSQDGQPNERMIGKLCDYTSKNPMRIPKKMNRKLVHISVGLVFMLFWPLFSYLQMASGDEPPRRSLSGLFRNKKVASKPARASTAATPTDTTPSATTPPIATTYTPSDPSTLPDHTTPPVTYSTPSYHFHPFHPPPSSYHYPSHPVYYPPPPSAYPQPTYYSQPPQQAGQPPVAGGSSTQDTRRYIEPEGETFNPPTQATHKIRDIIRGNFDAPYVSWKKIPIGVRDMWFHEFERDFQWQPQHHDQVRRNFERRGSARLADMFTDIRKSGQQPLWIGERVWAGLLEAWGSEEYAKKREQNKQNRASDSGGLGTSLHTGGSVPHTECRRRLKETLGREPTASELHTRTHQRQETQQWVDAKAQHANDEYIRLRDQYSQTSAGDGSSNASSQRSDFSVWSEAVGGKKKGRIYGLGAHGPTCDAQASHSSNSEYTGQSYQELMRTQREMMDRLTRLEENEQRRVQRREQWREQRREQRRQDQHQQEQQHQEEAGSDDNSTGSAE